MSLGRFLTDTVDVIRDSTDELPSGERDPRPVVVASGLPCRIREQRLTAQAEGGQGVVSVGEYVGYWPIDAVVVPAVNQTLRRQADGKQFAVLRAPELVGDPGHAMAHYALPLRRV